MRIIDWIGILVVIGIVIGFFASGITDVSVEETRITGIEDISADSLTLRGEMDIANPSMLNLPIDSIPYEVVLRETGETVASGSLEGFVLEAQGRSTADFTIDVRYEQSAETLAQLVTDDHVYLDLSFTVDIAWVPYSPGFENPVDIKQELQNTLRDSLI